MPTHSKKKCWTKPLLVFLSDKEVKSGCAKGTAEGVPAICTMAPYTPATASAS